MSDAVPAGDAFRSLLLAFVAAEPDPRAQRDMLRVMREHGHLPGVVG